MHGRWEGYVSIILVGIGDGNNASKFMSTKDGGTVDTRIFQISNDD